MINGPILDRFLALKLPESQKDFLIFGSRLIEFVLAGDICM